MSRRLRRGREFWQRTLASFERGTLSPREFCEASGLKLATFRAWRYRFQSEGSFVEVTSSAPANRSCVVRAKGGEIEFAVLPDAVYLAELLTTLGSCR